MVRCDGDTIPEPSIWAGKVTPDLNGEKRFLRGNSDSNVLNLEEDQMQDHKHDLNDPGHGHRFVDRYPQMNTEGGHDGPRGSDIVGDRWDEPHTRSTSTASTGAQVIYPY